MGSKVVTVLILSAVNLFTFTDLCTYVVLEGSNVIIELNFPGFTESTDLTWKKDRKTVVYNARKHIELVEAVKGSLSFKNTKLESAGMYSFEIYFDNGTLREKNEFELCVYAKVPKPILNFTCQDDIMTLKCDVPSDKGLTFSWKKNGKDTSEQKSSFTVEAEKGVGTYTCNAKNPAHNNTSDAVKVSCTKDEELLFGFDRTLMIVILAGGGFLVLLLIIVLISCSVVNHKQQAKRRREEEELRLLHLHVPSVFDQQKIKQSARGQPAPPVPQAEVPAPRMDQHSVKPQARSRPPPPPMEDDDDPPPLPQPRRKPHGKKNNDPIPYI